MKLCVSRSKNAASYYVAETYRKLNGRPATRIINKLGTEEELRKKLGPDVDITVWAKQHIKELTEQKNADNPIPIDVRIIPGQLYEKNDIRSFNVGYLVIQKMLYSLEFEELIKYISEKYSFDFDLEQIFSDLVCCRFIDPCSKKSSYAYAKENFLTPPKYDIHNVYRALDYIAKENDFIQSFLYKKSSSICARNTHVLFYDCTNFFFEIDDEDEFRKKGKSKENRTSPLVGMGMFIDGNGIPLGFSTYPGNEHDSTTLAPLEKRILKDFELAGAKLIICTDSGINSNDNMVLNSTMNRNFITIKSIKKMSEDDKSRVLDKGRSFKKDPIKPDENEQIAKKTFETNAWHDSETGKFISLEDIDEDDENNFEKVYYKEKECKDDKTGMEYRLIITYSIKYKRYMEHKRELDLKRAQKIIAKKKKKQIH